MTTARLSWRERSSRRSRPGEGCDLSGKVTLLTRSNAFASARPLPPGEAGRAAFRLLIACAAKRERITYADFAFSLGLGSPRQLGWLLSPLLDWCRARDLPWLPIIVVRRADGLPSGGYDPARVAPETERVFRHDWTKVPPPEPRDLAAFALPRLPPGLRPAAPSSGSSPC